MGTIEPDYVIWMNKAIEDGVLTGVPKDYIEKYMRPFVPVQTAGEIQMVRTMMAPAARDEDHTKRGGAIFLVIWPARKPIKVCQNSYYQRLGNLRGHNFTIGRE